jgi:predicted RND superfamily exporter protein
MWKFLANFILKNRLILIILLAGITVVMGYFGSKAELSHTFVKVVPPDDPDYMEFEAFKERFGQDDNVLIIGLRDSSVFELENFKTLMQFNDELADYDGIKTVVSLPSLRYIVRNKAEKRFDDKALFSQVPQTQSELDSILNFAKSVKFFEGRLFNSETGANMLIITLENETFQSKKRYDLLDFLNAKSANFKEKTGVDLRFAGVPYVRASISVTVKHELNLFLTLSILVTAIILFIFFRSISAVVFPLLVIGMVVIWTLGTVWLLGFQISSLIGLLPSILVVIAIPNCIYLLNKYHQEYSKCQNQVTALKLMIRHIGIVTVITNATTAIGFVVLISTNIALLAEFGLVAGINIVNTFIISIIFIPAVYSYLPAPEDRHVKHLQYKPINGILNFFVHIVSHHRAIIYVVTLVIVVLSAYGTWKVSSISYMVDGLPEESPILADLHFFEDNFKGVMPLEVEVNVGRIQGLRQYKNLKKIAEIEEYLDSCQYISPAVSMVSFSKAATEAYFNNNPEHYRLPNKRESSFIFRYLRKQKDTTKKDMSNALNSFVDSTGQYARISLKMADIGSIKIDSLLNQELIPHIETILTGTKVTAKITGTTPIFTKGNYYLIKNLKVSLLIACCLVAIIMGFLFRNFSMVILSVVPNLIPLVITSGLMGYLHIPLKPSTALIFSIAFGIAVDDSIHFLAKFRQELVKHKSDRFAAIKASLRETGKSMIYTSIILFSGFVIFVFSDFGGTKALGWLTSTTLLVAMFTNLILLPSLLWTFGAGINIEKHPVIEHYDEVGINEKEENKD